MTSCLPPSGADALHVTSNSTTTLSSCNIWITQDHHVQVGWSFLNHYCQNTLTVCLMVTTPQILTTMKPCTTTSILPVTLHNMKTFTPTLLWFFDWVQGSWTALMLIPMQKSGAETHITPSCLKTNGALPLGYSVLDSQWGSLMTFWLCLLWVGPKYILPCSAD